MTQTGVQMLSGLLLTVPFQQRFVQLTTWQRHVHLPAFLLATVSTGLLVEPVSSHRLLFREHEKTSSWALRTSLRNWAWRRWHSP